MKQKIILVFKQKWLFFCIMFESALLGSVLAAQEVANKTLETAFFLRKMYLKEAINIGVSIGVTVGGIIFMLLLLYETKKKQT